MKRIGCFALLLCLVLWSGNTIRGQESVQQIPTAVTSDPPPDPAYPATMAWPDILSHGSKMYSVLYIASGSGPHPTVLMLHGFPGNEKNLDLAYSIRRAGWNVLVPFYRGAWGSGGTFSFTHTLEDAQASIDFLRDSENAKKFRLDPARIVLVGHSMGGFVAAYAAAHEPKVFAVALVSPGNLGPGSARQRTNDPQFWERWNDNASRLVGTSAKQLVQEVDGDPAKWDYMNCVSLLKNRPVLVLEADDRNTSDNRELASRLRGAGGVEVTEIHMRTDHPFSDHRIAMQAAIVNWLGTITKPQLASQPPKEQAVDELSAVRAQSVGLQDETAIKTQLGAYAEARQRGDGPAQATFYTEDADRRVMNLVFKHGQTYGLIPRTGEANPMKFVRVKTQSEYEAKIITPEQCFRILMAMPQPERTLTLLIAATGLRISECLGLQWADVDYDSQQVFVRRSWTGGKVGKSKSAASRAPVPLVPLLAGFIRQWQEQTPYGQPTDWVFASTRLKGKQPRVANMLVEDHLRPAAVKVGVLKKGEKVRFGFHNLRHSLASFLVRKGTDVKTVQKMLRHSDVATTLGIYAHSMSEDRLAAQDDMLEAMMTPSNAVN